MKSLTLTLTLILIGSSLAYAQTTTAPKGSETKPVDTRSSDKLDIKKLEQKYWSAKDDDFSVVQNRKYTKAGRFFLSGNYGVPVNDPASSGSLYSANFGYFFNERWGLDLEYKMGNLKANETAQLFKDRYGTYPDYNTFENSIIASGTIVPFYAKMSFMDTSIIYFDMGFSAGIGTLSYEIQKDARDGANEKKSTMVYKLGVFQQIFFTEHLALRAELGNTWSNQERKKYYSGGTNASDKLSNKTINDTSLMFGLTFWF